MIDRETRGTKLTPLFLRSSRLPKTTKSLDKTGSLPIDLRAIARESRQIKILAHGLRLVVLFRHRTKANFER
jgi:hypothetical protein